MELLQTNSAVSSVNVKSPDVPTLMDFKTVKRQLLEAVKRQIAKFASMNNAADLWIRRTTSRLPSRVPIRAIHISISSFGIHTNASAIHTRIVSDGSSPLMKAVLRALGKLLMLGEPF